jgi:predicted GH43/DUF377 family glycosyl hydrolase
MQLTRHPSNPILSSNPANHWEAGSVFNPCVIHDDGRFRMYYRATNDLERSTKGGYISSIGYAESSDGLSWDRSPEPVLAPSEPYDRDGCEDPRITRIGEIYYMHYTAIAIDDAGTWNVRIAIATSQDGRHWIKHGIVGPAGSRSKAATLFPEVINGQYWWLYTWEADTPQSTILATCADSIEGIVKPPPGSLAHTLEHYDEWAVFQPPHDQATFRGPEVGAPPIKTDAGWLLIYCNANTQDHPEWTINAALLDVTDPRRVLAVTEQPILKPETAAETTGFVPNVTFPEGAVIVGEELYVYYGSGDQGCCLATGRLSELMNELKNAGSKV